RVGDDPAHRESDATLRADLDGDLVGRTTDAAALHLELRLHVVECLAEDLDRVLLEALADDVERAVEDALRDRLLAVEHQRVRELRDKLVLVLRVRNDAALRDFSTSGHLSNSFSSGARGAKPLSSTQPD